ncbi:hypothetical protein [Nocardia sp. NPDC057353]|uniref:hypothetical protein n=1 Tax=Nocardia sp. NPDC057353 TaxID=3346104 RepID=UPI0036314B28
MSQSVDWQVYYDAAQKCHDLAGEIRKADAPLHAAIKNECVGMAGDAPGCKQWGEAYDRSARETLQTCTNIADALSNLGYVLSAFGYNHGIANRSNPAPARPTVGEIDVCHISIPTSVADNGPGLSRHADDVDIFESLLGKVVAEFGKLPNGDVDKLERAATAWKNFSTHDIIANASARVAAIAGLLEPMRDENLEPIRDHIESVRKGAENLRTASLALATPVADYHSGTMAVQSAVTSAKWAAGLTVAAAAAAFFFTLGGSAALGAGGVTAIVANTVNTIRNVYQASNLIRAVGLAVATAGAVGVVKAFDGVPSLTEMTTGLASIIAMRVFLDDETDSEGSSRDVTVPATGPTNAEEVQDILLDRTEPGRNKPHRQLGTEAEIRELYDDLARGGEPVTGNDFPGKVTRLPDGTEVKLRESSTSGGTTIEIKYPGARPRKVHLP